MNGLLRSVGLLLVILGAAPGQAAAEPDTGLDLRISAAKSDFGPGEPIRLAFNVTNRSDAACGIATSETGTVRVISLKRDGQELRPSLSRGYYADGIQSDIAASLRTVESGSAVDVAVTGLRIREDDAADAVVIRSVSARPGGGGLNAMWPVGEPGRYELTAMYAVPEVDGPRCTGSTAAATVAFTVDGGGPPTWIVAAGVALAVLVLGGLVAIVIRRRAGRRSAGAALVLTVVGAVVLAGPSPGAEADLEIDPSLGPSIPGVNFKDRVEHCNSLFRAVAGGTSPAAKTVGDVYREVMRANGPLVRVGPTTGLSNADEVPEPKGKKGKKNKKSRTGKGSIILWNPTSKRPYSDGIARDPCSALFHEYVHAADTSRGRTPEGTCPNGLDRAEANATLKENEYRASWDDDDIKQRQKYGGLDLPKSMADCPEKPEKKDSKQGKKMCEERVAKQCAGSYGDPHLNTFDQLHYQFQTAGEFVLARGEGLEAQARHEPFAGSSRTLSVTTAVAFRVGETRLSLVFVGADVVVRVDGAEVDPERGERALPGGGTLDRQPPDSRFGPDTYVVRWPDGSAAEVETMGSWGLTVRLRLDRGRIGEVEGLYGDFDGDPANDLTPAGGGKPLGLEPEFEPLYRTFGESWRVRDDTTLFDYEAGQSTATFTDRSFPDEMFTVDDLDPAQRAEAEEICRDAGVTGPVVLVDCVIDVGMTGQPDFAVAAADAELDAPPARPITAPAIATDTLVVDRNGGTDRLSFTGKAGQVVFVDLAAATLPDQCGMARLLGPDGTVLNRGCVLDGSGNIDRTELPAAGQYTVELAPKTSGRTLVRIYEVVDDTGEITPDGRAETVTLRRPGSVGRFTFTGRAGQTVFVDVPRSSLPDQCSPLRLLGPEDKELNSGCVIDGDGYVDATTLKADGRHTVLVDPRDQWIGETEIRLTIADNQRGSITVDGEPVRATVRQPGATSVFEFRGQAGQRIRLDASDGTLPDQCGAIAVVGPTGTPQYTGCVIGGGDDGEMTLRAGGIHRVVFDPNNRATGAITLRLTT